MLGFVRTIHWPSLKLHGGQSFFTALKEHGRCQQCGQYFPWILVENWIVACKLHRGSKQSVQHALEGGVLQMGDIIDSQTLIWDRAMEESVLDAFRCWRVVGAKKSTLTQMSLCFPSGWQTSILVPAATCASLAFKTSVMASAYLLMIEPTTRTVVTWRK